MDSELPPHSCMPRSTVLLCMGTRPEIIKMAPVYHALRGGPLTPVVLHTGQHDSIAWPLKILDQLVDDEEVADVLLQMLSKMHTDYERDPQRKIDVIAQLEDRRDPRIVEGVLRFFEDVAEGARFHAVATAMKQANADDAKDASLELLKNDESVRVKVQVLDGFIAHSWPLDAEDIQIPSGYVVSDGVVEKR